MRYALDLNGLSLDAYLSLLQKKTLLPSRRALKNGAEDTFKKIQAQGIATVAQLLKALSTPAKIKAFAEKSGAAAAYLTLLRREAGTLKAKHVPLSAFPDTDAAEINALEVRGIKTSGDYLETQTPGGRLYALCDLTRINGIGSNAAALFYAVGVRSVSDIAGADAETLLALVAAANADGRYYEGSLGLKDIQFCIDAALLLLQCPR